MDVPIEMLVEYRDWNSLASRLASRFEAEVDASHVKSMFKQVFCPGWSDGTWLVWFKSRLSEKQMLPMSAAGVNEIRFSCELNIGFTQIEETAEMVERLRNEKVNEESQTARSRLNPDNTGFVSPIDKLAAVVAPQN